MQAGSVGNVRVWFVQSASFVACVNHHLGALAYVRCPNKKNQLDASATAEFQVLGFTLSSVCYSRAVLSWRRMLFLALGSIRF